MSINGKGVTEPGWYPDPLGERGLRRWDGAGWTDDTRIPDEPPAYRRISRYRRAIVVVLAVAAAIGAFTLISGQNEPQGAPSVVNVTPSSPAP